MATKEEHQEHKEDCRAAVRGYLAERDPLAFHPGDIARGLRAGHRWDFFADEVIVACEFLVKLGHAAVDPHELGATKYYTATAEGILAHERSPR